MSPPPQPAGWRKGFFVYPQIKATQGRISFAPTAEDGIFSVLPEIIVLFLFSCYTKYIFVIIIIFLYFLYHTSETRTTAPHLITCKLV